MPSAQDKPQGESRASTRVDLQNIGQDADEEAIPLCIKLWQSLQTLPPGPFPLGAVMCTLLLATGMLMCAYSAIKVQTMMAPLIPVFKAFAFIRKVAQMALFFKFTLPVAFVFSLLVIWRGMHTRDLFVGREGLHKRAYARLKQSANDGRVVHRGLAQKKVCVKDDFHHEITNTTNYAYLYTLTTAALSIAMVISTLLIVLCSAIFFTAFIYPVPSDEVCRLTVDLIQSDLFDESKTAAIAANLTAQGRMSADAALDNKRGQFNVTEELAVYDMKGVNHLIPGCDVAMLMRGCGLLATQACYRLPGMMDAAYWVLGPDFFVDMHVVDPLCPAIEEVTDSVTELCTASVLSTKTLTNLIETLLGNIDTVLLLTKNLVTSYAPDLEAALFNSTSGIDLTVSLNQTVIRQSAPLACDYLEQMRELLTLLFIGALLCFCGACGANYYLGEYDAFALFWSSTSLTKGVPGGAVYGAVKFVGGYLIVYMSLVVIYPSVHTLQHLPRAILRAITIPPSPPPMPPMPPPPGLPPSPPGPPTQPSWAWGLSVPTGVSIPSFGGEEDALLLAEDIDTDHHHGWMKHFGGAAVVYPTLLILGLCVFAVLTSGITAAFGLHAKRYLVKSMASVHEDSTTRVKEWLHHLQIFATGLGDIILIMLNAINVLLVALLFYVFVSAFKMLTIYGGGASEQCATAATTLHDVGLLSNLAADMVADPAVHHSIYVFETTPGLIHRSDEELLADKDIAHSLGVVLDNGNISSLCPPVRRTAPALTQVLATCETAPFIFSTLTWLLSTVFDSSDPNMVCPSTGHLTGGHALHKTIASMNEGLQILEEPCHLSHEILESGLQLCTAVTAISEPLPDGWRPDDWDMLVERHRVLVEHRREAKIAMLHAWRQLSMLQQTIKRLAAKHLPNSTSSSLQEKLEAVGDISMLSLLNFTASVHFSALEAPVCSALRQLQWAQLLGLFGSGIVLWSALMMAFNRRKYSLIYTLAHLREDVILKMDKDADGRLDIDEVKLSSGGGMGFLAELRHQEAFAGATQKKRLEASKGASALL